MYALVDWLALHYLLAKVAAAGVSFLANFGMRRWLLFTEPAEPDRHPTIRSEHR